MEFAHSSHSRKADRASLFMTSKEGGFGLVLIQNLDNKPVTIRCLRIGVVSNGWIKPEIVARSMSMAVVAVSCLRTMMKGVKDLSQAAEGDENSVGEMEDIMYTFAATICDSPGFRQASLNEKKLQNYLRALKGTKRE